MTKHAFPLVADGEPIIESARQMALYENEDLITNIAGSYQDKHYDDIIRDHQFAEKAPVVSKESLHHSPAVDEDHSYAQKARRQAKQAVKEKDRLILLKIWLIAQSRQARKVKVGPSLLKNQRQN